MIYQVLTMVIMILWKPLMSNDVLGLKDLREFFDLSPDRRHIRMDPHNKRESLSDL
jgi:hypothetical protein